MVFVHVGGAAGSGTEERPWVGNCPTAAAGCYGGIPGCVASCDPGDVKLAEPCPSSYTCYERAQCGTKITCLHGFSTLDAGVADDDGGGRDE